MTVRLVKATALEAPLLAALHEAVFSPGGEPSWPEETFASLLSDPCAVCLIAVDGESGESPLGLVLCQCVIDEGEVLTIGTIPSARRRGVARLLLQGAFQALREIRVGRLFLEVAEDNPSARALYDGAGFVQVGLRKGYYPARTAGRPARHALIMACSL